jgi:anaerobic magnesium-protoporphyrin IX monomethyl ester cyclase
MKTKAMLILPPSKSAIQSTLGVTGPPLGLGYLASALENNGHEVRVIDSLAMGYDLADVKRAVQKFDPELVGITATTPAIYDAYAIARVAKEVNPDCRTILGGPHVTFMAKETLKECPQLDVVVKGEGEQTIAELASGKKLGGIKGIAFRKKGKITENEKRGFVKNLDEIPFPAYHLLPMKKYEMKDIKFSAMVTSRGCPFQCVFCSSSKLCGKIWRGRSPENVLEEIKLLREKYGVREIEFLDDTFTLNKERTKALCALIRKEKVDITWSCSSRVDTINEGLARELKEAGCHSIYLGVESGSQRSLNFLKKGINLNQAKKAVTVLKKLKLNTVSTFIIGIPGETVKAIEKTIKFAKKLTPTLAQFTLLTPYPGTEIYDFARKNDLLLTKDWSKYTTLDPVMKLPRFTARKLKGLLRKAYINFYCRPAQILRIFKWGGFSLLKALGKVKEYY